MCTHAHGHDLTTAHREVGRIGHFDQRRLIPEVVAGYSKQ